MRKNTVIIVFLALILLTFSTYSPTAAYSSEQLKAIPGYNHSVMSVTTVRLNGSASTGDVITYSWKQTAGIPVTLSNDKINKPTFTSPGLTPGATEYLEFDLTVDDGNDTSTASVTITVLTWKQVDTGLKHTIALRSDGTVWAWGLNFEGQIGQGNKNNSYRDMITQVGTDSDWTEVSAGDYHNLALKSNGTIYAWGKNRHGQIGNNTFGSTDVTTPTRVGSSSNWVKINAGEEQSYAIDLNGNIYGWGRHNQDRLGLGEDTAKEITTPAKIREGSFISGGGISTLAVNGTTLWCWGNNAYGQLAVPDTAFGSTKEPDSSNNLKDIAAIASGGQHSYIIRNNVHGNGNFTLWSMGINTYGELGTSDPNDENPVPGEITVPGVTSWKAVAAGKNHGLAIAGNGTLWAWGYNNNGQLGLGDSGSATSRSAPEQVGTDTDWYDIAAWMNHSAGLKDDGTLWIWGASNYSAIGDSDAITDGNNAVNTPWRIGY